MTRVTISVITLLLIALPHGASADFPDVPQHYQYSEAINWMQFKGTVHGNPDGTFRPDDTITRAAFTKIIVEASGLADDMELCDVQQLPFTDVDLSAWYAPYMCIAYQEGIMKGYEDATVRPAAQINSAEAAKILSVAFSLTDVTDAYVWYRPYFEALEKIRAIPQTVLSLDQFITRGEMAEMVYRIVVGANTSTPYTPFMEIDPENARPIQKLFYNKPANILVPLPHDVFEIPDGYGQFDATESLLFSLDNLKISPITQGFVAPDEEAQRIAALPLSEYTDFIRQKNKESIVFEYRGLPVAGRHVPLMYMTEFSNESGGMVFEEAPAGVAIFTDGNTKYRAIIRGDLPLFRHLGNQWQKSISYGTTILRLLQFSRPPYMAPPRPADDKSISRNIQRLRDLQELKEEYAVGNLDLPVGYLEHAKPICQPTATQKQCSNLGGVYTGVYLDEGVSRLPQDPFEESDLLTGYYAYERENSNHTIYVYAPYAELGEWIMYFYPALSYDQEYQEIPQAIQ